MHPGEARRETAGYEPFEREQGIHERQVTSLVRQVASLGTRVSDALPLLRTPCQEKHGGRPEALRHRPEAQTPGP